jgi:hypothetical protein
MHTIPARPYRWPYHAAPDPRRTALLVFSDPCDAARAPAAVQRLGDLVNEARAAGVLAVALPPAVGQPVLPLTSFAADAVISRPHLGAFAGTALDTVLRRRGIADLLIAGFPFELGADCTMREANDRGYECLVVEDCCSGIDPQTFAGAISSVQFSGGIFGAVARLADVLDALREETGPNEASASGRPLSLAVRRRV